MGIASHEALGDSWTVEFCPGGVGTDISNGKHYGSSLTSGGSSTVSDDSGFPSHELTFSRLQGESAGQSQSSSSIGQNSPHASPETSVASPSFESTNGAIQAAVPVATTTKESRIQEV